VGNGQRSTQIADSVHCGGEKSGDIDDQMSEDLNHHKVKIDLAPAYCRIRMNELQKKIQNFSTLRMFTDLERLKHFHDRLQKMVGSDSRRLLPCLASLGVQGS
jgi:site-specific recombinase